MKVIDPKQSAGSDAWNLALRQRIAALTPSHPRCRSIVRSKYDEHALGQRADCFGSITMEAV
jgi:hypothetical protein